MRELKVVAIAAWGILGVALLLMQAIVRLTPLALEPWLQGTLGPGQAALYVGWVVFNGYVEGYRAFQKRFCPRVVGRALHLGRHPRLLHVVLAAPYSMALFHAKRRNLLSSWGLVSAIVVLVLLVHQLPQPWRGIVDGGVVVGLIWGVVALWVQFARVLLGAPPPPPEGIPEALESGGLEPPIDVSDRA